MKCITWEVDTCVRPVGVCCLYTDTDIKELQTKVKTNQPTDGHADMGILRLPYTFRFKVVKVMEE